MNRLRFMLSLLVGYFFGIVILLYGSLLFNYELISFFVVVLVCVLMCIDLVFKKQPGFSRNFLWLVAYVFYFIWLMRFGFHPINSIQSVYRIFTEIFVITIGLNLSAKISLLVGEAQNIVEKVSFSMIKPPAQFDKLSSEIEKEFSKISVVGSGMTGMPGIMAKIVKALSSKDIMIYECTDSYTTISCLVKSIEEIKAITALHKEFKLGSK